MQQIPHDIYDFLQSHHVLSVATTDAEGVWAASCFYVYDPDATGLVMMSSLKTRHAAAMQTMAEIAGTIAGQPERVRDICGVQFTAHPRLIDGAERKAAMKLYVKRHPAAKFYQTDCWMLDLIAMKYTSNKLIFAQKTLWHRDGVSPAEPES